MPGSEKSELARPMAAARLLSSDLALSNGPLVALEVKYPLEMCFNVSFQDSALAFRACRTQSLSDAAMGKSDRLCSIFLAQARSSPTAASQVPSTPRVQSMSALKTLEG